MKKNRNSIKPIIFAIFFIGMALIYFNHLGNKSALRRTNKEKTDIETLMDYDMEKDYPKTPRDVVKLHNQYFKLFYGKKLKDEEIVELNRQIRYLYSEELLLYNDEKVMLNELKKNIDSMNEQGYVYKVCELPEASQIIYYEQNGKEMATLEVIITMDVKKEKGYMYNQYVLVKENGLWKILAWGQSRLNNQNEIAE